MSPDSIAAADAPRGQAPIAKGTPKPKIRFSPAVAAIRAALARGSDETAISLLASATAADDLGHGHLLRSRFYRQRRRFSEALLALEEARKAAIAGGMRREIFLELTDLLLQLGSNPEALDAASQGVQLLPGDQGLAFRRARALARCGHVEASAEVLSEVDVKQVDPNDCAALVEAVRTLFEADSRRGASTLKKLMRIEPVMPELHRLAADFALKQKDLSGAIAHLEAALDQFPEGPKRDATLKLLSETFARAGRQPSTAVQAFAAARALEAAEKDFRVAVITNVYNEKFNLPIWLGHYGRQVGIENCIVLDHGSDDGSTADLGGSGMIRLPRGKVYDERNRMSLINNLANDLLGYYDAVIYTDCDEMLVADPLKYTNLADYAKRMNRSVVHAIGLNVRHDISKEPPLVPGMPLLEQRTLVQFVSPMCKPLLIKKPVSWGGGFHSCDREPFFSDLYLFHLRHADMEQALARLRITRDIKFAREGGGTHHRREDAELIASMYEKTKRFAVDEGFDFTEELKAHIAGTELAFSGKYAVFKAVNTRKLNRVPPRFRVF